MREPVEKSKAGFLSPVYVVGVSVLIELHFGWGILVGVEVVGDDLGDPPDRMVGVGVFGSGIRETGVEQVPDQF
jgi:hypothetical protein